MYHRIKNTTFKLGVNNDIEKKYIINIKMADLALFEKMIKAKELYKKLDKEQFEYYLIKDKIYNECQDVEKKFFNCLTNIHLNRILTPNMTTTEKKFKCYNEILASNKIYVEKRKLSDLAFREYYVTGVFIIISNYI